MSDYNSMRMNGMSPSGFRINEQQEENKLSDLDPMPFGKHKGLPMQDVPADYLHYLWVNGKKHDNRCLVADYIRRNLNALKQEHKDGIW